MHQSTNLWKKIRFLENHFAVLSDSAACSSLDAFNWSLPITLHIDDLTFQSGTYVAVSSNSIYSASTLSGLKTESSRRWNQPEAGITGSNHVGVFQSNFLASVGCTLLRSSDGLNWQISSGAAGPFVEAAGALMVLHDPIHYTTDLFEWDIWEGAIASSGGEFKGVFGNSRLVVMSASQVFTSELLPDPIIMGQPRLTLTASPLPRLEIDGKTGKTYEVEARDSWSSNWVKRTTISLSDRRTNFWFDTSTPGISSRFYRAKIHP